MVLRDTTLESLIPSVNIPLVERYIYIWTSRKICSNGEAEKYVPMEKQKNMYQWRSRKIYGEPYG